MRMKFQPAIALLFMPVFLPVFFPALAQIDIDPNEIGRHYPVTLGMHADARRYQPDIAGQCHGERQHTFFAGAEASVGRESRPWTSNDTFSFALSFLHQIHVRPAEPAIHMNCVAPS